MNILDPKQSPGHPQGSQTNTNPNNNQNPTSNQNPNNNLNPNNPNNNSNVVSSGPNNASNSVNSSVPGVVVPSQSTTPNLQQCPSGPPSTPLTPSSDCSSNLIPNSQLIASLSVTQAANQSIGAPSSASSSLSAPQTPLDGLNTNPVPNTNQTTTTAAASTPGDGQMAPNGLNRPNVSTPSSVFNNSAPNTPMPCPSVSSTEQNITSPALNVMADYGPTTVGSNGGGSHTPTPVSITQSPFQQNNNQQSSQQQQQNQNQPNTNSANSTSLLSSPLSVHASQQTSTTTTTSTFCNIDLPNNKNMNASNSSTNTKAISNGNNKKHCNNRQQHQQQQQQQNINQHHPSQNTNQNGNPFMTNINNNQSCVIPCGAPGPPPPPPHALSQQQNPNLGDNKNQMNFQMTPPPPPPHSANMPCMQNGLPINGSISPFDVDNCKMNSFPNDFSPNLSEGCPPPGPNSCGPGANMHRLPNPPSSQQMGMQQMSPTNMMNQGPHAPPPPPPGTHPLPPPNNNSNKMCGPPMHMMGGPHPPPPPPLPNMKPTSIDGQFHGQNHNQVFVFSTMLANEAADAVFQLQCQTILHFHMNHPHTKKFIEKNSIKLQQNFNRPNNWIGNMRQPSARMRGPNPNGISSIRGNFNIPNNNNHCFPPYNHNPGPGPGGGPMPPGPGMGPGPNPSPGPGPGQWNPNWSGPPPPPPHGNNNFPNNDMKMDCNNSIRPQGPCGPQNQYNNFNPQGYPPMVCNDSLQDDNLTPQQKRNRENKLAILANLQQKLMQQDLIEPNNRLPQVNAQPPPPNDFIPMDPMGPNNPNQQMYPSDPTISVKQENQDPLNQGPPHPPSLNPSVEMNFQSSNQPPQGNFCTNPSAQNPSGGPTGNPMMNFPVEDTKPPPFQTNSRRKGSQNHQSPLPQPTVNSPNSCMNQSPSNRVPPPPYSNQSLRTLSSPHPGSPATLSLPSPRMSNQIDSRQSNYTPSSVRSGPSTPSADAGPPLINSPKSSSRANSSPSKKKQQQQQQQAGNIDGDMNSMFSVKSEHSLMPVPSPQQIDYINTFEGQELTIQKQPNAHFQESNDLIGNNDIANLNSDIFPNDFNPMFNNSIEMNSNNPRFPITSQSSCNFDSRYQDQIRFNGNNSPMDSYRPGPLHMCSGPGGPGPGPAGFNPNEPNMRFSNSDMNMKSRMSGPGDMSSFPPPPPSSNSMCDMNFPNSIPPINDGSFSNVPNHGFNDPNDNSISSIHLQNLQKMTPPFDIPPSNANKPPMGPNMMPGGPSNNQIINPVNSKGPRMPNNYDSNQQQPPPPFGPPPPNMGNLPPCSDMNDTNSYGGGPPHMSQSNMSMNYPGGGYSGGHACQSQMHPSNMLSSGPPNDPQFGGPMHSSGGSFSPMPMNTPPPHSLDQNPSNGSSPMSMPIGGGNQGNFPVRMLSNINRPMNPPNTIGPRYNSPNIQVKPDAPNTIQYLPSRPQAPSNTPPNRPPNLDFLQPSLNMNNKQSGPPPPGNQYFPPNSGPPPNRPPNMSFARGPIMRSSGPLPPQNMNSSGPGGPPGGMCVSGNGMFNRGPPPPNMNHNLSNGPNPIPTNNFGNGQL